MMSTTAAIVNFIASILAAFATVVLAVYARRQWRVMKENNESAKQQNELVCARWKREDESRAEGNKPKAVFGLERELTPILNYGAPISERLAFLSLKC